MNAPITGPSDRLYGKVMLLSSNLTTATSSLDVVDVCAVVSLPRCSFREDPTNGGDDPSAQDLILFARSISGEGGSFDHRMDQPCNELGDLVEMVRVGRQVERGPGSLEQPAGEHQCRAARHVIGGCTGAESSSAGGAGSPGREPLEEQAADLRHHLLPGWPGDRRPAEATRARSGSLIDPSATARRTARPAAGIVPIDGRAASRPARGPPQPIRTLTPLRLPMHRRGRATNPLSGFLVVRRRSAAAQLGAIFVALWPDTRVDLTLCERCKVLYPQPGIHQRGTKGHVSNLPAAASSNSSTGPLAGVKVLGPLHRSHWSLCRQAPFAELGPGGRQGRDDRA